YDLTLVESAQAGTLDSGNVDEYVLAAALRLNKSVAFGRIKPFHSSCCHVHLLGIVLKVEESRDHRAIRSIRVLGNDLRAAQSGSLARQTENLVNLLYNWWGCAVNVA